MVVDPAADAEEAKRLYGIAFRSLEDVKEMDAVIVAVAHSEFQKLSKAQIAGFFHEKHREKVLMDIKGLLNKNEYGEGYLYWRL